MDPSPAAHTVPSPSVPPSKRWRLSAPWVFVQLAFVLSRLLYWHEGVLFDLRTLGWFFQFIEPQLLHERLLESVYYLHSQPPLFNLFLGGVLQAFPESAADVFAWLYVGMGLLLSTCLYGLLVRLGISRWPSALVTVLFMVSPATVLYENWLFYTYPEALLLCASALLFHRFMTSGRPGAGVALFASLGTLALVRSAFHLLWYLAMVGLVLVTCSRASRRTVLLAAAGPLLVLLALYTKNAALFGTFSASSWFGMNFAQIALKQSPLAERQDLVREGKASALALQEPFLPLSSYAAEYRQVSGPDVPVLRREMKPSHWPNFNHEGYVRLSRDFARESFAVVRARPGTYLGNVLRGVRLFFTPASDYPFVANNREQIPRLSWLYNCCLLGMYGANAPEMRGDWLTREEIDERTLWNWLGLFVLGLGSAGVLAWREHRSTGAFSAEGATRLFLASNILYVALLSNLFEYLENNRIRYPIDPLILALGVAGLTACARAVRARLRG